MGVTLSIDVTSVNGVRFFRSISRHLNFRTIKFIPDSKKKTLLNCIKTIAAVYAKRGFCVTQIHGDNEFECLREDLAGLTQPIDFFPVGAGDHEPYVERDNRTFKERFRCIFAGLPFKRITVRMIIELGYAITFWRYGFGYSGGITPTVEPEGDSISELNDHSDGDPFEWESCKDTSESLLECSIVTFNVGFMVSGANREEVDGLG